MPIGEKTGRVAPQTWNFNDSGQVAHRQLFPTITEIGEFFPPQGMAIYKEKGGKSKEAPLGIFNACIYVKGKGGKL